MCDSLSQILLIDELLDLWFDIFFEHVAFEVGDLDAVIFLFVMAGRDDDS